MGERLGLYDLKDDHFVTPVLYRAIETVGTQKLVDFFRAPNGFGLQENAEYENLFAPPTCPDAEYNWGFAFAYGPNHIIVTSHAYEELDMAVKGGDVWVSNSDPAVKPVFLKNPLGLNELVPFVGMRNVLFDHEGILFIGDNHWPSSVVECVRPASLPWQFKLRELYDAAIQVQAAQAISV